MSMPSPPPPRPPLSASDFYFATGTAAACWDTSSFPLPPTQLLCAISTGISHLFRLLTEATATAPTSPPQQFPPLAHPAIAADMARDAQIPEPTAAALLARLYVDIQAVPSVQAALSSLPLPLQRAWAAEWAALAHAAWAAAWYPELIGRPTYAAGDLSAGWPILFTASAQAFDDTAAPATRRLTLPSATASLPLPRRVGNAIQPPTRLISSAAAFRDRLEELLLATPISTVAKQLIEEFATTVAYHYTSTGQVPVTAWGSIPSPTGEPQLTVHDARLHRQMAAQPQPMSAPPPVAPHISTTALPPTPQPQALPPASLARPTAQAQTARSPAPQQPVSQPPQDRRPPLTRPTQPQARPIAGSSVPPDAPRNAPLHPNPPR